MAAPPSYEEHTRRWALEACADDPAMRAAFTKAGAQNGWVAVDTVIDEHVVREIIPELKAAGAEGIVEYPLNKVVY